MQKRKRDLLPFIWCFPFISHCYSSLTLLTFARFCIPLITIRFSTLGRSENANYHYFSYTWMEKQTMGNWVRLKERGEKVTLSMGNLWYVFSMWKSSMKGPRDHSQVARQSNEKLGSSLIFGRDAGAFCIQLFDFDRSSAGIEGKSISLLMKLIQVRIDFSYSYNK
jgi:hypothetical protein